MGPEKKTMISIRLPAALVVRLDYVARNTEVEWVRNRSTAAHAAINDWVNSQEERLRVLGVLPKKAG